MGNPEHNENAQDAFRAALEAELIEARETFKNMQKDALKSIDAQDKFRPLEFGKIQPDETMQDFLDNAGTETAVGVGWAPSTFELSQVEMLKDINEMMDRYNDAIEQGLYETGELSERDMQIVRDFYIRHQHELRIGVDTIYAYRDNTDGALKTFIHRFKDTMRTKSEYFKRTLVD